MRRSLTALLPLLSWLSLGCQSPGGPASPAGGLYEGPTRWLMMPDELRQVQRLGTTREAVEFLEVFWKRRDPDPEKPGNECARTFYQRVEAADRLYSEGGTRGSLTARGRALILLGPPPVMRYSQKRVPEWEPGRPGDRPEIQTRSVTLESWVYTLEELEPEIGARIEKAEPELRDIELVFLVQPRQVELLEGEKFLELAVQARVRDGSAERPEAQRPLPPGFLPPGDPP